MVVCPLIDVIDYVTLEYQPSPVVRGAFNWYLQFKWDHVFSYEMEGPEGPTRPIRSPAMAGGIFAINRHYFNEIGQYDKGMNLWGGENLELSLRVSHEVNDLWDSSQKWKTFNKRPDFLTYAFSNI
ncbi:hypothetical protein EI555_005615, partial [Monodon monoceros]